MFNIIIIINIIETNKDQERRAVTTDLVTLRIEEHLGDFGEGARLSQGRDRLTMIPLPQSYTAVCTSCEV